MNTAQKLNVKIVINSGFKNNALNTNFYHNMIIKDIILLSLKTFQESDKKMGFILSALYQGLLKAYISCSVLTQNWNRVFQSEVLKSQQSQIWISSWINKSKKPLWKIILWNIIKNKEQ